MKREIFKTADGSHSFRVAELDEQYHSKHGAIQEANHVYIDSGLNAYRSCHPHRSQVTILEAGFGTGLNALLTALLSQKTKLAVQYTALESDPIEKHEWQILNYPSLVNSCRSAQSIFEALHRSPWDVMTPICDEFKLKKRHRRFQDLEQKNLYDVVFYDAFGPRVQPELWTVAIFQLIIDAMTSGGILVTYSAKGSVRRNLKQVGFTVEKIPGPPGKREMLRAEK